VPGAKTAAELRQVIVDSRVDDGDGFARPDRRGICGGGFVLAVEEATPQDVVCDSQFARLVMKLGNQDAITVARER